MYLVEKIIDKCEYHSAEDWKRGSVGNRTIDIQQSDYDNCGKTELLNEIWKLRDAGLIEIKNREGAWASYNEPAKVWFQLSNLPEFYRLAKEKAETQGKEFLTKAELVEQCYKLIADELARGVQKEWIRRYYQGLVEKLDGIGAGTISKDFEKMDLYIKCFRGVDSLDGPMYKRVFSKKYLGNSKLFENKEKRLDKYVISVAKTYCDDVEADMDDAAVLSQIYIKEYSQEMALKGPLKLNIFMNGKAYPADVSAFVYGAVLNTETLRQAEIDIGQLQIRKVVTVENKANFVSMPYEEHTLYIFSHGYFSPMERAFLQKLENALENVRGESDSPKIEYFHSGDLDYGGVKIFEYIKRRIFPKLRPMMMDVETFLKYENYSEPISGETWRKLKKTKVEGMQELINLMIETKKGIEQESFLIS